MALRETERSGVQNVPQNLYTQNPPGSDYAATYSQGVTKQLRLAIDPKLILAFPEQFTDLAFFMSLNKQGTPGKEFYWMEVPWDVIPVEVRAGVGATAASPPGSVTQVVPITDATVPYVAINTKVTYPDLTQGVIISVTPTPGSATATVRSMQTKGLPALVAGDLLGNAGQTGADGQNDIKVYNTMDTLTYSNLLERVGPETIRWDRMQLQEWKNLQTTDFMQQQYQAVVRRVMTGIQQRMWLSDYDVTTLTDGETATYTRGILKQQSAAGVPILAATSATVIDVVRQAVFDTALVAGGRRVICGTRRLLHMVGMNEKAERTRYVPSDTSWNMDIYQYSFFGHELIAVPMDQWEDRGSYGNILANDLVILNKEDISIRYMDGIPMVERDLKTLSRTNSSPGSLLDYELGYCQATFGMQLKKAHGTARVRVS